MKNDELKQAEQSQSTTRQSQIRRAPPAGRRSAVCSESCPISISDTLQAVPG